VLFWGVIGPLQAYLPGHAASGIQGVVMRIRRLRKIGIPSTFHSRNSPIPNSTLEGIGGQGWCRKGVEGNGTPFSGGGGSKKTETLQVSSLSQEDPSHQRVREELYKDYGPSTA